MKLALIFVSLGALAIVAECLPQLRSIPSQSQMIDFEFEKFKETYSRKYDSAQEEARRKQIFAENLAFINDFNAKQFQPKALKFTLAVNHFADYTDEEFAFTFLSPPIHANATRNPNVKVYYAVKDFAFYEAHEWGPGVVSPVADQGKCASGWAFAAAASIEGLHSWNQVHDEQWTLSVQNLIDCSKPQGNRGCEGGDIEKAFQYVIQNGGIDLKQSYPFKGEEGECHYFRKTAGASISSYSWIDRNEDVLASALRQSTIAATIDASRKTFRFYANGIYDDPECSSSHLNHGITVTGVNFDNWLLKNSWGAEWGEAGFMRLARDKDNLCGIASHAAFGIK